MSYVVKNCPALMGNRLCYSKVIKQCADCTDCVIKQVIEKCRDSKLSYSNLENFKDCLRNKSGLRQSCYGRTNLTTI